jgi:4-hydroxy-tetrahydrodipicolinate synthase
MSRLRPLFLLVLLLVVLTTLPCPHAQAAPWVGVYPTVLTPFCEYGVDTAALERELRYQLHGSVHGFLLLDTLGEGESIPADQRAQVIAAGVRVAGGRVPVIATVHACRLDEAGAQVLQARQLGASAVLVRYVGNPHAPAAQVLWFYAALDNLHALPIFYEHAPATTGLKLTPDEVTALINLPGVVGIREPGPSDVDALVRRVGKAVFTSTGLNLNQVLERGGQGAMCPEAALLPGPTVQLYTACVRGRHEEARLVQKQLFATASLTRAPAPTILRVAWSAGASQPTEHPEAQMKAALNDLGVPMSTAVRCPAPPLCEQDQKRIATEVTALKAIDWDEAHYRVPGEPRPSMEERPGYLLHTGAIQLGSWVGRNGWRWMWDGEGGF